MEIPRLLHMFWDGPPLPEEYRAFPSMWRELNPGWDLEWWDDARVRAEIISHTDVREAYAHPDKWSPKSNVWQWRSDLARYHILQMHGGFWVDADMEPLKTIEPLRDARLKYGVPATAVAAYEQGRWINNAFLGCTPQHPFMRDIVAGLPRRVTLLSNQRVNRSIGARYITLVAERHSDLLVLPREQIYPFYFNELHRRGEEFPEAYMKHHWHNKTKEAASRPRPRLTGTRGRVQ